MDKIPVKNIGMMIAYALGTHDPKIESRSGSAMVHEQVLSIFARMLASEAETIMKGGLVRQYVEDLQDSSVVRGKPQLQASLQTGRFAKGVMICRVSQAGQNHALHRFMATVLKFAAACQELPRDTRASLRACSLRLSEYGYMPLSQARRFSWHVQPQTKRYQRFVGLARMFLASLSEEESGSDGVATSRLVLSEAMLLSSIFEGFVRGFARVEVPSCQVLQRSIAWDLRAGNEQSLELLPDMVADLVLQFDDHVRIVETKCYVEALQSGRGGAAKLRSAHFYQVQSYALHFARTHPGGRSRPLSCLVLYPRVALDLDAHFHNSDFEILFRTVDLDQPWPAVHNQVFQALVPKQTA